MSTPATRKGRRKLGLLASVAAALGLFLTLSVGNAAATVTCSFDFGTGQVQIVVSDDSPPSAVPTNNTITVQRGGSNTIVVNGQNCLDPAVFTFASTLNTQQINVSPAPNGADGNDTLVINETAGEFIPGAPTLGLSDFFSQSLNEIEWYVNLGLGFNTLTILKPNGENAVTIGSDGGTYSANDPLANTIWDGAPENGVSGVNATPIPGAPPVYPLCYYGPPIAGDLMVNLNSFPADDDADIFAPVELAAADPACSTTGIGLVVVDLGAGDDYVNGKGGDGTGAPTSVPLVLNGGTGDDTIIGGLGSDTIIPGGGNDFADGNAPFEGFRFASQNDVLGEWGLDFFDGDVIDFSGETGPLTITLNADGSLTVNGVTGTFLGFEGVIGSQGDDTITGNNNSGAFLVDGFSIVEGNLLVGAGGNDTIDGLGGNDFVDGDNVSGLATVPGTPGNDNLAGGLGNDVVVGGPGDDTLDENKPVDASGAPTYGPLGNGADSLDGGEGTDTVTYSARTTRVVVYLGLISTFNDGADTNADGLTNEFDDVFFTTENAITGSGQDIISANFVNNRSNNVFTDNGGNDCLEGGPGNDTFETGSTPQGADVMIGDTGADTANYANRTAAVAVSLDGVANDGDIATNEGDNVGGLSTTCRPLTLVVNPPQSVLIELFGVNLPLILNELQFTDAPVAGPTPSQIFFTDLSGQFEICEFTVFDPTSSVCPGETLGGDLAPVLNVDVENVNGGSGNDIIVGDSTGNLLNGNAGDDDISGGASADQLNGGDGNDLLRGGAGNDALDGGAGTNTADYSSAGAGGVGVQVNLTTGTATGEGNDTLKADTIQRVNGSSFADSLSGNAQDNVLNGNGGNDAANGNGGNDTVNGGAGADQLKGASGDDKITGAEGNDAMQGGSGNDNIQGGQGKDTALGQKGNDKLYGNAQPDFLNGGPGQDVCKPGSPGLARGDVVVNCES